MKRLARENPHDFVVLAVDQGEGKGTAKSFTDSLGVTSAFEFALDRDQAVSRAYQLPSGLPHSFFIDKDGVVRVAQHGGMTYDQMKQFLAETRAAAAKASSG